MIIIFILLLGVFLRLYRLDDLPSEMWGDVIEHYKLAKAINEGDLFFDYRFGGDGPLISYFISFFSRFFGLSFFTLKFTTAILGVIWILVNYNLSKALFKNKKIAYLSAFLTASGFWCLTFSRQGKPYLLAGFFTSLFLLNLIKKNFYLAGLILGLGMYTQTAFWGMALFSLINIKIILTFLITSLLFIMAIFKSPQILFNENSYLGEKFVGSLVSLDIKNYIIGIFNNYYRNLLALIGKGDGVFRHNVPYQSSLDPLMKIFFIIGTYFFIIRIIRKKDKNFIFILLTIILAILPTSLDVKNYLNNPSMGRTIGMVNAIYLITSFGIYRFSLFFKKHWRNLFIIFVCFFILIINFYQYFFIYPQYLPNQNTPFGRIIAQALDKYNESIPVFLLDCCWGDWGQPEPEGIKFQMKKQRNFFIINNKDLSFLQNIKEPILIIDSPSSLLRINKNHLTKEFILKRKGYNIAKIIMLNNKK